MRRVVFLLLAINVTVQADVRGPVDRTLTLDESVKLGLNNSQLLLSAREDVTIALQRVQQAEAQFYPKLDLNANWSKFGVDGDTPLMIQPSLGPTLVPNNPRQNYYTFRANIYQSVYEGGRGRNTWKQARIVYERAKDLHESMQVQVAGAIKQAFYDLLMAQERSALRTELSARVEKEASRRSSKESLSDRLRLEHGRANVRASAAEAAEEEAQARLGYLRSLNLELNTQIAVQGELKTQPVDLDLQKLLAWASRYRSELRQTEYQQESDALGIRLSLAERTPRVALGASYERTGYDVDLRTINWAGTLNVNLPLSVSDLLFGWAKVREHRAQYRQATLRHTEAADVIEKQVRQAYTDYRFWQGEIPKRNEERARLKALLDDVRRSTLRLSDRLDAEEFYVDADLRYQEAVHGHLSSLTALERATGKVLNDP